MNSSSALARLALAALLVAATAAFAADKAKPWKGDGRGRGVASSAAHIVHVVWEGNASHIGRYTADGNHVFSGNLEFAGTATFTAANGDEIDVTYEGARERLAIPRWFNGTMTIRGGTGRFKDAGGAVSFRGFEAAEGPFTLEFEGELAYRNAKPALGPRKGKTGR